MANVRFLKSEVVITQPWIELPYRKFCLEIDLDTAKRVLSLKPNPGWISSSKAAIFF